MSLGPVQVLVVAFPDPTPTGEALAELARLEAAGVVRLVDLLLVRRGADGALETVEQPEGSPVSGRIAERFFAAEVGGPGEGGEPSETAEGGDTWSLLEAVPDGGLAAVALIEHVWAGPLREAIARAGGIPAEETWLAPADLAVLESLLAP